MKIQFILIAFCIGCISASMLKSKLEDIMSSSEIPTSYNNGFVKEFDRLSSLYFANFEQKLFQILTTTKNIDDNLKALQEKAHVWDLYRHHIAAWDEYMKALDHKVDLIKYNQDDTKLIEGKLASLEFSINHILSKLVQMDNGSFENDFKDDMDKIVKHITNGETEKKEILNRLSNILRHILTIENSKRRNGSNNLMRSANIMKPVKNDDLELLTIIESKLDQLISNLPIADLKQLTSVIKSIKQLEEILNVVNDVDETTTRLFAAEAQHSFNYLNICQTTANEISSFTESADLLLKRIEKSTLNIEEKFEQITLPPKCATESDKFNGEDLNDNDIDLDVETVIGGDNNTVSNNGDNSTDYDFVQPLKKGCHDLIMPIDGVYKFYEQTEYNEANRDFYERYCTFPTKGLGWTVIQRRGPYDFQENFNRSWTDYRNGFGSLAKDFWFGNEFLHQLIYYDSYELRIELEDFNGTQAWAEYSMFQIDSEKYNYNLLIGGFKGNVTDSMLYHHNQDFSTFDRRNDKTIDSCCPCAKGYGSGWWFDNCSEANLNGIYRDEPLGHNFIGIVWEHWHGDYSLKSSRMLIRPKNYNEEDNKENITENP